MRPVAAIVEPVQVDVDLIAEQIIVAINEHHGAETSAVRHEQLGSAARETARMKRIEIGRFLLKVRPTWKERGPNAKGWGEFLERVKLKESTAKLYMDEAKDPEGFRNKLAKTRAEAPAEDEDDDTPEPVLGQERDTPPFRQLTKADLIQAIARLSQADRKDVVRAARVNVRGGSGDEDRGTWCTSADWAIAVGTWYLDPFSNARSHILSETRCMLEDGGDGFGGSDPGKTPGLFLTGTSGLTPGLRAVAHELTRVWIQPPYELVAQAIAHYGHTRFCALLRWSPDVKAWFPALWRATAVVCHPFGERMEFEPPPGVDKSGDMPFPHALYYAHEADVTDEVRRRCLVWRVDHDLDPAGERPALHIVP